MKHTKERSHGWTKKGKRRRRGPIRPADVKRHFAKRCFFRYDITVTPDDIAEVCDQVRSRRATYLYSQSRGRSVWLVKLRGQNVPIVYRRRFGLPFTALEPYMINRNRLREEQEKRHE